MYNQKTYPKFSIITITFNAEKTLETTIQSVISQTYSHIEYILVDGASTDGTLKIAQKYAPHIHHMVSEPDNGLYDAMNKGIELATGDYLCFLNAGDKLHKATTIEDAVERLQYRAILPDIIYGETAIVDEKGTFMRMRRHSAPEELNWKSFKKGMLVCHQAFWVHKNIAEKVRFNTQYRYSADFDWCIRCMLLGERIFNTRLTLIDYLNEGISTRNRKESLKERYRIMCHFYGRFSTFMHHLYFVVRLVIKR